MLLLTLALTACQTIPQRNQVEYLLRHPQFKEAKTAAPVWAKEALGIINDQQLEIETLKADR